MHYCRHKPVMRRNAFPHAPRWRGMNIYADGTPSAVVMPCCTNIETVALDRVEIAVESLAWEFAIRQRDEIDRHFARLQSERPALWNGRVLLLSRYAIRDGTLRGACFETDYANFIAWRDWNFPDPAVYNVFAAAALRAADGAYLVGEMAPYTASGGQLYFPCGTPEPADVDAGGALDLAGNLCRELREETGIDIGTLTVEPGWTLVRDRGFMGLMRRVTAAENADDLRARIMRYLASERQPELSDIRIVRGPDDLDPRMPRFVVAFLEEVWRQ
jgi:8-oxo-dGTP pyrophosphatase MutT (NUDIX family)